jgi:hypothetical protein
MPGRVGKLNEYGAPWGGWDDPTEPRPSDDEKTRHNRAALASWLDMRRTGPDGVPMEDEES